jgi:transcriptional regulator with XRE-family HTH domain
VTKPQGFPERLAQERRHKGVRECRDILKKDVAKAIGVSESTLGRWENGIGKTPDDEQLGKLAAYFGVTLSWLRYGQLPREAELDIETPVSVPFDPPDERPVGHRRGHHRRRP